MSPWKVIEFREFSFRSPLVKDVLVTAIRSLGKFNWRVGENDRRGDWIGFQTITPWDPSKPIVPKDILNEELNEGERLRVMVWLDLNPMEIEISFQSRSEKGQKRWEELFQWFTHIIFPTINATDITAV